jgi:hypothetical protein
VSSLSFGAIVALGHALLRHTVSRSAIVFSATGLLALSPVLLGISKMAWSDPPFIVVSLVFLLVLARVWERHELTTADSLKLAALCWIAFLLRYAGIALIATGGAALLISLRPFGWRVLGRVVVFGVAASAVPLLWMARNHAIDGTLLGPRLASPDSLGFVLRRTVSTFDEWLRPSTALGYVIAIVVAAAVLARWLLIASRDTLADPPPDRVRATLWCCALFAVVYVVYLTAAFLHTAFGFPDSRYLSPVYVPLVVLVATGVDVLWRSRVLRPLRYAAAAALFAVVAGQVVTSIGDTREAAAEGTGFNRPRFTRSGVAASVAHVVDTATTPVVLYSNNPNALWAATGVQPIHFSPREVGPRNQPIAGQLDAFVQAVACSPNPVYLVVYALNDGRYVSLAEVKAAADLQRVVGADDGVVFRVEPRSPAACSAEAPTPVRLVP